MRNTLFAALLTLTACSGTETPPAAGSVADVVDEPVAQGETPEDVAGPEVAPEEVAPEEAAPEEAAPEEASPEGDATADAGTEEPVEEAAPAPAAVPTPADIVYPHAMGKVTFSHTRHVPRVAGCVDCHPAPFGMVAKAAPMLMDDMYAGKLCGKCHATGGAAFDSKQCMKCHIP